jgi:hypothetical protein
MNSTVNIKNLIIYKLHHSIRDNPFETLHIGTGLSQTLLGDY